VPPSEVQLWLRKDLSGDLPVVGCRSCGRAVELLELGLEGGCGEATDLTGQGLT
jgi:hypothetical protein